MCDDMKNEMNSIILMSRLVESVFDFKSNKSLIECSTESFETLMETLRSADMSTRFLWLVLTGQGPLSPGRGWTVQ